MLWFELLVRWVCDILISCLWLMMCCGWLRKVVRRLNLVLVRLMIVLLGECSLCWFVDSV